MSAAVIAEPVRWTTLEMPPADFWPRVRASCDRHGALLIFDEIPSCLGRTGTMFACEQVGCVPDMLVLGKGLGGGVFPMAALIAREDLDVAADRALGHYTHEKSSVGCAAALATLDVIRDEGLLERSRELGVCGLERLRRMQPVQCGARAGRVVRCGSCRAGTGGSDDVSLPDERTELQGRRGECADAVSAADDFARGTG